MLEVETRYFFWNASLDGHLKRRINEGWELLYMGTNLWLGSQVTMTREVVLKSKAGRPAK